MKFKLHAHKKTKMLKNKNFLLSNSDVVILLLTNVKMPTIVGILKFMSMMNLTFFMLNSTELGAVRLG